MIHVRSSHHEEIAAIPYAIATTAALWPIIRAYLNAVPMKTEKEIQDEKQPKESR